MNADDIAPRNATYRSFVALGRAPTVAEVASSLRIAASDAQAGWEHLAADHALVLDGDGAIRMANPFAASETPYRVEAGGRSWFANCAWDSLGIGAALAVDSTVHTTCPDCSEPLTIAVREGRPDRSDLVFHVLVPAVSWWEDIGFT
ncbi:MAG: organomercurial lyase [Candidatus Limnocylindrales bacterium]